MNKKEGFKTFSRWLEDLQAYSLTWEPLQSGIARKLLSGGGGHEAFERGNSFATPECYWLERWVKTCPHALQETFHAYQIHMQNNAKCVGLV